MLTKSDYTKLDVITCNIDKEHNAFIIPIIVFSSLKSCNLCLCNPKNKNTMFWVVVLIAFILKTCFTLLKSTSNNKNIIFFIIMLNVDIYCLNLTIMKKHRRYYEYSCKEDGETYENTGTTNFMTQSI